MLNIRTLPLTSYSPNTERSESNNFIIMIIMHPGMDGFCFVNLKYRIGSLKICSIGINFFFLHSLTFHILEDLSLRWRRQHHIMIGKAFVVGTCKAGISIIVQHLHLGFCDLSRKKAYYILSALNEKQRRPDSVYESDTWR